MDPRSSAAKSILLLGAVLTILGIGTWLLVAREPSTLIMPALFGTVFLGIGVVLLKARGGHRHLLWLSVLLAIFIIASSSSTFLEALRASDGTPVPPEAVQQVAAVLLCVTFVFVSVWRLVARPLP